MKLSSRSWAWWAEFEDAVVAEQGPQHVDPSASKSDERLNVLEALSALLEVEIAVGSFAHHGR